MNQQTLAIIKPDAVSANTIGLIISEIEKKNLSVIAMKMINATSAQAEGFYQEHNQKGFFKDLVAFMTSGRIVVMVLNGDSAISNYRALMGATNPAEAEPGTIRSRFATSIDANAVHGSDSESSAQREIYFFFKADEIFS